MRRLELVERCSDLLIGGSNISVVAAPGMGKSELVRSVGARLQEKGAKVIPVPLPTEVSGTSAFRTMASKMSSALGLAQDFAERDIAACYKSCEALAASGAGPVVLVLDGMDAVINWNADAGEFLRHLRELLATGVDGRVRGLLASRRSIRQLELSVRGVSTLADICPPQYVKPAAPADLTKLWGLNSQDAEVVWRWSGGIPALATYRVALGSFDEDLAHDDESLARQLEAFKRVVEHLDLLQLLPAAMQTVLGPQLESLPLESATLRAMGVLRPRDAADAACCYVFAEAEPFIEQLAARARESDVWGSFGVAERRLRELVEAVLTESLGLDWAAVVVKRSKAAALVVEKARAKQATDERRYGRSPSWLAYTYPDDLWQIINATWESFREVFRPGEKPEWRSRIIGLAEARAPMAHGRAELLSEGNRLQVKVWSEEVIRCADNHLKQASP